MNPSTEAHPAEGAWTTRVGEWWPTLLVTLLGLQLLWPASSGQMPMSADHTVHVARAQLWSELLAQGSVRGWNWQWFVGGPIGEFYPPLGDLLVILPRALSFGLLSWGTSYALAFTLVFVLQGWSVCFVTRRLGFAPTLSFVAGALALLDAGYMREGGWFYTVELGVWPQVLSTSLMWLGIGASLPGPDETSPQWSRGRLASVALAFCGALLAHPAALPAIVLFVPLWLAFVAGGEQRGRQVAGLGVTLLLALGLAAWWLMPMLQNRAWMASYGWLYASTERMTQWALEGAWTHNMPPTVGWLAFAGMLAAWVRGPGALRALALYALGLWLLAGRDVFWWFRLDLISEGFTHIQYQRFLLAAKPAFYLLALWPLAMLVRAKDTRVVQGVALVVAAILFGDAARNASDNEIGEPESRRREGELVIPESDADAAVAWLNERSRESEAFYRVNYRTSRNLHTLMDLSGRIESPVYKSGFTPGDNFVHKPESAKQKTLDPLRVRYVVRVAKGERDLPNQVARFGAIRITERRFRDDSVGLGPMRARVRGAGQLRLVEGDAESLTLTLTGADADTRVEYLVAGHPRWQLELDGTPIEWFEAPLWGDGPDATIAARRRGELRGGRAEGDDGSEPILLAATPGKDGTLRLHYRRTTGRDWLAGLLSLLALLATGVLLHPRGERVETRVSSLLPRLDRLLGLRPLLALALLVGLGLGLRWTQGAQRQAQSAPHWGWSANDSAGRSVGTVGPFKTNMLIRPSIRVPVPADGYVDLRFESAPCGLPLEGWVALDDDWAKLRTSSRFTVKLQIAPDEFEELARLSHRPGRTFLAMEAAQCEGSTSLSLRIENRGKKAHTLGLWLEGAGAKVE